MVKIELYLPHEELLDGMNRTPCPNLAMEDTYGGGGEDEVHSRHVDGVGEVVAAKRFVAGVVGS